MGLLQASRAPLLAEIARTKNSLGYLMPCSVAESVRVICDSQKVRLCLDFAQVELTSIETYLCESFHRSLILDRY